MAANCAGRQTVPISDVTDRVGDALSELCQSIERLEGLIAPLLLEAAGRNPSHLQELQDLDHICQKLGNIADFVAALALVLPDDWRLDPSVASRVVTMSDLSSKLSFTGEAEAERDHTPGDFELF
jgi:hypothetical protein